MSSRDPPNGSARLTRAATKGGKEGGTPHPVVRAYRTHPRNEGYPQTWQRTPLACGQGTEEEGGPPTQQRTQPARRKGREGDVPKQAACNHSEQPGGRGRGKPP